MAYPRMPGNLFRRVHPTLLMQLINPRPQSLYSPVSTIIDMHLPSHNKLSFLPFPQISFSRVDVILCFDGDKIHSFLWPGQDVHLVQLVLE